MYFSDPRQMPQSAKLNWVAIAIFFLSLFYYLSFLHINIAHAHDAPMYYHNIITANVLWHAHHVVYEPLSFLWLEYSKLIFPEIHPFKLVSAMNSFFGAGCVSILYLILAKRLEFCVVKSLLCCFMIATSFYYLNYATTVEVYHSALFFMLATFYYALKNTHISFSDAMVIGVLHGLAMSFHQMHVLLGIVLLPRLLKAGYWQSFIYILYGTIIVVFMYLLACYAENIHDIASFKKYFIGYMGSEEIVNNSSSSVLAPLGLGMALLGGRYIMGINPFRGLIHDHFTDSEFDRIFYLHHKTSALSGGGQIVLYCIFIVCLVLVIKHYIKNITMEQIKKYCEYYMLIMIYSLFFTFWYPHNPEFWGVSMTFIIIVMIIQIHNIKLLAVTAISVFMINLLGSGLPLLDSDNNLYPNGIETLFKPE